MVVKNYRHNARQCENGHFYAKSQILLIWPIFGQIRHGILKTVNTCLRYWQFATGLMFAFNLFLRFSANQTNLKFARESGQRFAMAAWFAECCTRSGGESWSTMAPSQIFGQIHWRILGAICQPPNQAAVIALHWSRYNVVAFANHQTWSQAWKNWGGQF